MRLNNPLTLGLGRARQLANNRRPFFDQQSLEAVAQAQLEQPNDCVAMRLVLLTLEYKLAELCAHKLAQVKERGQG